MSDDCRICTLHDHWVFDLFGDIFDELFTEAEEDALDDIPKGGGWLGVDYENMEKDHNPSAPTIFPFRTGRLPDGPLSALKWINEHPGELFHWFGPPRTEDDNGN